MSDPSTSPRVTPETQLESSDDEPSAGSSSLLVALVLGLFKIGAVGLLIYLTYFFTMTFAYRTPPPAPLSDEQVKLASKAEELRNQGKTLLSSYGWVNPATKSNVRIPIERAMELLVAEAAQPSPATAVAAAAPGTAATLTAAAATKPGGTTGPAVPLASTPAASPAPAPAPAPPALAGMRPEQLYHDVCLTCHGTDGRGKLYRLLVPSIPDLTDAQWQAKRTDDELKHSILEGKDSIVNGKKLDPQAMVSQKVNLERAQIDVKDMIAFMRGFKDGKQEVTADGVLVQAGKAVSPAGQPTAAPSAVPATMTGGTQLAGPVTPPKPISSSASSTGVVISPAPGPAPSSPPAGNGGVSASPILVTTGNTAAQSEKVRAAGVKFNTLCVACHGPDGRGLASVRTLAPALPDFTSRDFQSSRNKSQLITSIMEGKGTAMPPWRAQLTQEIAQDLVAYVRIFGPAGSTAPTTANSEFAVRYKELQNQYDELNRQIQALSRP